MGIFNHQHVIWIWNDIDRKKTCSTVNIWNHTLYIYYIYGMIYPFQMGLLIYIVIHLYIYIWFMVVNPSMEVYGSPSHLYMLTESPWIDDPRAT